MWYSKKRFFTKVLATIVFLALFGPSVSAQQPYPQNQSSRNFRVTPGGIQSAQNIWGNGGANYGNQAGFRYPPNINPYYGTNVYAPSSDPYGGYMSGAADVINAQANFMKGYQQSKLIQEQVNQSKIETRRRNFDEYLYEKANTPTPGEVREQVRLENLRRSLNNPPLGEIWSAKALNDIFQAVQQFHARNIRGPSVPLGQAILEHINLTSGATSGSLGLLRDGGQLHWPIILKSASFDALRQGLDQLAIQAYQQAAAGNVQPETVQGMTDNVQKLRDQLLGKIADYTPLEYMAGKRFLEQLDTTTQVLQDPNVANYVNRKWVAQGDSVADLMDQMIQKGLSFAPALDGDQPAYVAMHHALVTYDLGLAQLASMGGGPSLHTGGGNN